MEFNVIYEQTVKKQARYIIECDDAEALNAALDMAEMDMQQRYGDRFDDLLDSLRKLPGIKVVQYDEEYSEDWDAPEYYDHYPNKEGE